ncbi:MAG: penicillin acylase family protein [Saprospiraceae bacterium]|nr:penicillin acylase family protein [Saprospiraceae bacterium]
MKFLLIILLFPLCLFSQSFTKDEISRWEGQAKQVTIIRDNYGVPHIYGKKDADAVFGLLYAQCEDDFKRVEMNYIEKLGRMAEVTGSDDLYEDLLIRMIIDSSDAVKDYNASPAWMKKLCNAFADGVNYYLYKHPEKKPALLNRFKPWYPMLWTDGSIGAINTADITVGELKNFYSAEPSLSFVKEEKEEVLTGSNGFAFAPKITESGHAILYINPHVTFYFRPEVHMVSEEGLNVYGAVTWGQFFVYQGFNEKCGWIHTSSAVDAADTYIEKVSRKGNKWVYTYDGKEKPVITKKILLRTKNGSTFDTTMIQALFTHHGPVMTKRNGKWLSLKADNRILNGLIQCWQRNKATGLEDFKKTLDLKGNISNNTVYADAAGNIAYWHGNRIPTRDAKFDWSQAVDGGTPATEWTGYHNINETVFSINPSNGWLQNCNSTPFTVAGDQSPKREKYPVYMAPDSENFRGINAVRTLSEERNYNIDKVIKAGYDRRLAAFEVLVPALVSAFEQVPYEDSLFALLAGPIAVLKKWDFRCGENSIATTLAVEWGQNILPNILNTKIIEDEEADQVVKAKYFAANASAYGLLRPLLQTVYDLQRRFGRWQTPWGEINRFQRISSDLQYTFDDNKLSYPVAYVSSTWGMLPSYDGRTFPNTKKRYGVHGNSFVCAVEFGPRIKAKSLLAGGQSGDEKSPHFFDQGQMYSQGQFKDVLFYKEDVLKNAERSYNPGEK